MTHHAAPARVSPPPLPSALQRAVMEAVAYADVFDYPLTAAEVHRYLPVAAPPAEVEAALAEQVSRSQSLERVDGYITLPGRAGIVEVRRRRAAASVELWPRARRYGRAIAALPFVRMVAVTGSLAMANAEAGDDIDYLVVTENGRLWLSRALAIGVVRVGALRRQELCPNYFLTESALCLPDRNLFTAHELAQMVPVAGGGLHGRMLEMNPWYRDFLPNADPPRESTGGDSPRGVVRRGIEAAMRGPAGDRLERWEMTRKRRKFEAVTPRPAEARFAPDYCKGHFEAHGARVLAALEQRVVSACEVRR